MQVYVYAADIYCKECGEELCRELSPFAPDDERTYDSDEFPKGPYCRGGGEADCPQHCGSGADCYNAIELANHRVGAWLENELTTDGVDYVREAIREGGEVAELWAKFYADYDLEG